ncbi:hypothetical protein JA9_001960 [Meyerozyma sp. JA9]|nr:hypothetical protein JA9_001960 [Meyerozyma sp. JA9]
MYSGPFDGSPVNTYIHGVTGISGTNEEKLTMVLFSNLEINFHWDVYLEYFWSMKVEIGAVDTRVFPYYKKLTYKPDGNCFQFQTEFQRPESDVDINEGIQLIMNVPQKSLS